MPSESYLHQFDPYRLKCLVTACPNCGSGQVHLSRTRSVMEWMRQALTSRRPQRCHRCGWREWRPFSSEFRYTGSHDSTFQPFAISVLTLPMTDPLSLPGPQSIEDGS